MKRLAIFLDGTWNTLNNNTNVWRLKSLCAQTDQQRVYYSQGVGTVRGESIRGGVTGYGIDAEIIVNLQEAGKREVFTKSVSGLWLTRKEFTQVLGPIARGTGIGSILGKLLGEQGDGPPYTHTLTPVSSLSVQEQIQNLIDEGYIEPFDVSTIPDDATIEWDFGVDEPVSFTISYADPR